VQACSGKSAGASCSFAVGDMTVSGICRAMGDDDSDDDPLLACLPPPPSPPPAPQIQACVSKNAGDACSFSRDGKTLNGICHQLPNGGPLVCLPPPPRPPQEAIDACTGHAAGDACSFTFKERTVSGACEPMPDATTLVCAPVCRPH